MQCAMNASVENAWGFTAVLREMPVNLKEKPIGPVQVAVWRHLVVVVFSDVASGPCSSGVSRTTVGIAGISTRSDGICQTEKIDQGTE